MEALTQGCIEQPNIYDVFEKESNRKVFVVKEESDPVSRCCCAPGHSLFAKFYPVGEDGNETGAAVMTLEREGCDCCCTGPCPKPCLCCFACTPACSEQSVLHAGDIEGKPGEKKGSRDLLNMLGQTVQPKGGGGFKPVMQIMDRDSSGQAAMFAATRGPCLFGGCSEFCVDSRFGISVARPGMEVSQIHTLPFGDFASITKVKPNSLTGALREAFTDSDIYEVHFNSKDITIQQKANILGSMLHLDYMFFERDNDMLSCSGGDSLTITFCNCFVYGCICPCQLTLSRGNGND